MEKQLIPKLRFPEFQGEFKSEIFNNILSITRLAGYEYSKYWQEDDNKEIIALRGYNIGNGKLELRDLSYISNELSLQLKRSRLNKGDIIYPCVGTIGNAVVIEENDKYHIQQNIAKITCNKTISPYFISQFLMSHLGMKEVMRFNATSSQPNVLVGSLRQFSINLPSLPEQQKIASFLTDVDDKITQLTKKKELLEQYKKGVMQKIFSQELRFKPDLSGVEGDDNGNDFPKWEEKKLGSICNYKNGGSFEQYVSNEGVYNLISLNSLDINGKLKPSHKKVTINDNSLDKGDLVMVLSDVAHGYFLGLTDIVPDNTFVLNQRMGALKPKININSYFLKTYINFNQKYFKLMGQGSSQQNLSKGDILKFTVKTPIIEEQIKIANFLSDIDIKIEVLNTKIENSKAFKKGLLQQMFV